MTHPRPASILALTLGLALLLTLGHLPSGAPAAAPTAVPSYAGLMQAYRAGDAKQIDEGFFGLYANDATLPSGWLWAVDDTRDGNGREYWILHTAYPYPGPDNDGVRITFDYMPDVAPTDLTPLLDWIVATYDHVTSTAELSVHECKVRPIQ